MLTTRLIAAALMLPMPNAYAETQTASNMVTTAAAITLYKIHCRGKIPASAVETVNTTIREYGESRVVASAEIDLQREKLGHAAFCVHVEKTYLKKINVRRFSAAVATSREGHRSPCRIKAGIPSHKEKAPLTAGLRIKGNPNILTAPLCVVSLVSA